MRVKIVVVSKMDADDASIQNYIEELNRRITRAAYRKISDLMCFGSCVVGEDPSLRKDTKP